MSGVTGMDLTLAVLQTFFGGNSKGFFLSRSAKPFFLFRAERKKKEKKTFGLNLGSLHGSSGPITNFGSVNVKIKLLLAKYVLYSVFP